jgi:uncharacterized protein
MNSISHLKSSRFNLEVPLNGRYDGLILVYNTFSQGFSIFEKQVWENLKTGSRDTELLPYVERCREQFFLVKSGLDETRLVMARKQEITYDTRSLSFKVAVTDHCNFACAYCVEEGYRNRRSMDLHLARRSAAFIIDQIKLYGPKKVFLDFGGGEPLLNIPVMTLMGDHVSLYCRGAGMEFEMALTSNGSLLSPKCVERLRQSGLNLVRVTLLPQEVHDRFRRTRTGKPTFSRIVGNLEAIKGMIEIHIVAQYISDDPEVVQAIRSWLNHLEVKGLKEAITEVHLSPILRREYGIDHADDLCGDMGRFEDYRRMLDEVRSYGFPVTDGPPATDCMANRKGKIAIDPAGNLTVCPVMMGHRELDMGTVEQGIDPVKESQIIARPLPAACLEACVLGPRCNGGCRQQAFLRSGSFDAVHCNYDFHMAQLKDYLLRRAEQFLGDRKEFLAA